ncbi:hypothetical protein GLU60_01230 [Nanohaloarchaea archaeon H01]|nr:hypothetical protein [Nanohaloarchaea archaeon H01]
MKKVIELLKAYLLDLLRTPIEIFYGLLLTLGFLVLTAFILNQGAKAEIIASYSVFVVSYAAISAVAYSITMEKENGLYRMYKSSKLSKTEYVAEKVVMALLPIFFSLIVVVIGYVASNIVISALIFPILLISALAHAGIGLIFGSFFETHSEMQKAITLFLFGMFFLAPVFYSPESLPDFVLTLQRAIPLTYGIEAMRSVMVDGSGISGIWSEIFLLSILSIGSFLIGYRRLEF